VHVLVFYPLLR